MAMPKTALEDTGVLDLVLLEAEAIQAEPV